MTSLEFLKATLVFLRGSFNFRTDVAVFLDELVTFSRILCLSVSQSGVSPFVTNGRVALRPS